MACHNTTTAAATAGSAYYAAATAAITPVVGHQPQTQLSAWQTRGEIRSCRHDSRMCLELERLFLPDSYLPRRIQQLVEAQAARFATLVPRCRRSDRRLGGFAIGAQEAPKDSTRPRQRSRRNLDDSSSSEKCSRRTKSATTWSAQRLRPELWRIVHSSCSRETPSQQHRMPQ